MPTPVPNDQEFTSALWTAVNHVISRQQDMSNLPVTPDSNAIELARSSLPVTMPEEGLGTSKTIDYLISTILPGILQAQSGPRYFGFVTGGVTPAAQIADILVGSYDENVQVALPQSTASTAIESRTLEIVLDLLSLPRSTFRGRTITTGATASNVLGLACAREWTYSQLSSRSAALGGSKNSSHRPEIVLLAIHPHFSIVKAAALVGLGVRGSAFRSLSTDIQDELSFDLAVLETVLEEEQNKGRGVIVCGSIGEVNTGGSEFNMSEVARLCKQFGAWLHIDAAFGGIAAVLPEYSHLSATMSLADSLTLDGHKWLNVPYECGLFYTRHPDSLPSVFAPAAAATPAYLSTSSSSPSQPASDEWSSVPSPLMVGIENSRRFRALPLLASLLSLGKSGYTKIIQQNLDFARRIAQFLDSSPSFELLNRATSHLPDGEKPIIPLNIILFRGSNHSPFSSEQEPHNTEALVQAINGTRKMYVTGTEWRGQRAIRLAVSNWQTGSGGQPELDVVINILNQVMAVGNEDV